MFSRIKFLFLIIPMLFFAVNCGDVGEAVKSIIDAGGAQCGDGVTEGHEACDSNGFNTATCDSDCSLPDCGDGTHNSIAGEECDFNDPTSYDSATQTCSNQCTLTALGNAVCGDGNVDPGEDCDPGASETATCDLDCSLPVCGDGYLNAAAGEVCDPGIFGQETCNPVDCLSTTYNNTCGDGIVYGTEECDDGNTISGDGCDASCMIESSNYPTVTALNVTGTPTGANGKYQAGDTVTISWAASASSGLAGVMVFLMSDYDFAHATTEPAFVYSSDPFMENPLPGNTTSHTFVLPDAYSGTYYPAIMIVDNTGNGVVVLYDSFVSTTNFTLHLGIPDQGIIGTLIPSSIPKASLSMTSTAACGDGTRQMPEQCDDGNTAIGDGCNSICNLEPPKACAADPLNSVSRDLATIDVSLGEQATITVDADYSCVDRLEVRMIETTGTNDEKWVRFQNVNLTTFQGFFPQNQWVSSGTWTIGEIRIDDGAGMTHSYAISQVNNTVYTYMLNANWGWNGAGGTDTAVTVLSPVSVTGGTSDTAPPAMSNVVLSQGTPSGAGGVYLPGDTLTYTVTATDALSGVEGVDISMIDDQWNQFGRCWTNVVVAGTTNDYSCTLTLTGTSLVDPASIYPAIYVMDAAQNGNSYSKDTNVTPLPTNYSYHDPVSNSMILTGVAIPQVQISAPLPTVYSTLTLDAPETGMIAGNYNGIWLSFDATAGNRYTLYWNDAAEGDGAYSGNMSMELTDGVTGNHILWADDGYFFGATFTAPSTGTVYIRVHPQAIGTFGVRVANTPMEVGTWGRCLQETNSVDAGGNPIWFAVCEELRLGGLYLQFTRTEYLDVNTNGGNENMVIVLGGVYTYNTPSIGTNFVDLTTDGAGNVTGGALGAAIQAYNLDVAFDRLDLGTTDATFVSNVNTAFSAECGGNWSTGSFDFNMGRFAGFNSVDATCATALFTDPVTLQYSGPPKPGDSIFTLFGISGNLYLGSQYDATGAKVYDDTNQALRPVYLEGTIDFNDVGYNPW